MNGMTASAALASGRVRLANVRQISLVTAKMRVLWVLGGFVFMTFVAIIRIGQLGISEVAPERTSMAQALLPSRGEIADRNGLALARAFASYSLWYNPKALGAEGSPLVKTPEEIARALLEIFPDANFADLVKRLKAKNGSYLHRRVLPEEANRVFALGEPALEFPREEQRFYPQGSLAAHVLGYVDQEGKGKVGMESVLEQRLLDPARRGAPTPLAIDARVQGALEDELMHGMLETSAKAAAGLILDVDTGEVIALASLPAFNPNRSDLAFNELVSNRVSTRVFELGSTFKPITIAAAIDAGVITDLAVRYPTAPFKIGGFTIHDSHDFGAFLNVPEALIHSSNVVTAQVADKLGAGALRRTMMQLGMNERPTIELPARGFPLWPRGVNAAGDWSQITTMTVSYGHGIAVTPLHLAAAYAALVNGGIWRPATLYKLDPAHVPAGRRVFKASTSARMRQLLRMIVAGGTGRRANAAGFRVGGKTGSAEKSGGGGYRKTSLIATFAAAFPMDKPRYVVIAMLDEPQATQTTSGQRTAAYNVAPIVKRVVPRIGPMLGVVPDSTRDVDISDISPLVRSGEGE
ncbi:penicillin-binding protein 2 [Novosphingobium sp. Chol11]|uniref:peptidoglycan D,D-transpeptidase FtsI family protein n=1 Tax=Novosphingobium sp. Chol11 TaxID=1385763 RepID=UPI0025DDB503|nr:penicillin-binding protein 2 [Novosphingobium sp. Chol11]